MQRFLLLALALWGCAAPLREPTAPLLKILTADTVWDGAIALRHTVTIPAGIHLTLAAGTRVEASPGAQLLVQGTLRATGTATHPVVLTGDKDNAAALVTASSSTANLDFAHVEVRGAGRGVAVNGGSATLTAGGFFDCDTGLDLEAGATAKLTEIDFTGNQVGLTVGNSSHCSAEQLKFRDNQVGLGVNNSSILRLADSLFQRNRVGYAQQNPCDTVLERCTFEQHEVAAVSLRQTRRSPTITFATFRDNQTAIAANQFSHVLVEASTFEENRTAFAAINFCGAFLRYNTFRDNDRAIRLDKKSNARLQGNLLKGNRVALFADYSTYPTISGNQFTDNEWHVRLGIYESADWEQRQGSREVMMKAAQGANSRNPLVLSGEAPTGPNLFSVAGNAWDAATETQLQAGGEEDNVTRFWDGRDQAPVSYPGFAPGLFAVDVIRYLPTLPANRVAVGPAAWQPLEAPRPEAPPVDVTGAGKPPPPAPGAALPGRP